MTSRLGLVYHSCGHQTPVPSGDRHVAFPCGACRGRQNVAQLLRQGRGMVGDMLDPESEAYVELPLGMAQSLAHWAEVVDRALTEAGS